MRHIDSHRTAGARSGGVGNRHRNSVYPSRAIARAFGPQQYVMRVNHLPIGAGVAVACPVLRLVAADRDDRRETGVTIIAGAVAERDWRHLVIRRPDRGSVDR